MIVPAADAALAVAYSPVLVSIRTILNTKASFHSLHNSVSKSLFTFRVSHLLHGSRSNHDWHGDLETQDGCCHINLAHVYQNPRPEAVKTSQSILCQITSLVKPYNKKSILS